MTHYQSNVLREFFEEEKGNGDTLFCLSYI
jgi:hypothetical protein